jgi:dihydrofolate reductase
MSQLIYAMFCSADGYTSDREGNFDWAAPDSEVHQAANDLEKRNGTCLYGRRMYEVMTFWETASPELGLGPVEAEYATLWRDADKVVFSTTLVQASTARTRIERRFDPEKVRRWKREAQRDLSISGPGLAAQALQAGLVDVIHLFLFPVVVGGGTKALPDGYAARLELLHERRFASGVIHLHYRVLP